MSFPESCRVVPSAARPTVSPPSRWASLRSAPPYKGGGGDDRGTDEGDRRHADDRRRGPRAGGAARPPARLGGRAPLVATTLRTVRGSADPHALPRRGGDRPGGLARGAAGGIVGSLNRGHLPMTIPA